MENNTPLEPITQEFETSLVPENKTNYLLFGAVVLLLIGFLFFGYQNIQLQNKLNSITTINDSVIDKEFEENKIEVYSNSNFNILIDKKDNIKFRDDSILPERAHIVVIDGDVELFIIEASSSFSEGDPDYNFDEGPVDTKLINDNTWKVFHMTQSYADAGIESEPVNIAILKTVNDEVLYEIYIYNPTVGDEEKLFFTDVQNQVLESIRFE